VRTRLLCILGFIAMWIGVSVAEQSETEIVVILKAGQSIEETTRSSGTRVTRQIPGQPVYLVQPNNGNVDASIRKLGNNAGVEIAELNRPIRLESGTSASGAGDAALVQSMAALLDGQARVNFYGTNVLNDYVNQPALQIIRVRETRNISTGAGTRIAYIDTGVDADHPALRPWLDPGIDLVGTGSVSEFDGLSADLSAWVNRNTPTQLDNRLAFVLRQSMAALLDDGSGGGTSSDLPPVFGHGTLVAGLLHVVAPAARIVPIRAFDTYGKTTIFKLAEGIYRASDLDVDVLNMSFSTTEVSPTLQRAILYARSKNVALVASGGNESSDVAGIYPAASPLVVGVAATDFNDRLATFSNYGSAISLSAPGSFVVSTAPGGRYAMAWGTSFSAPIVAGSIALVSSLYPQGLQDVEMVVNTADPIDDQNPGYERQLGSGRLNLQNALKSRGSGRPPK
jgi:subtilisin family serine protease